MLPTSKQCSSLSQQASSYSSSPSFQRRLLDFPPTLHPSSSEDHFTDLSLITSIQDLDKMSNLQLEMMVEDDDGLEILMHACHSTQLSPILSHLCAYKLHLANLAEENINMKLEFGAKKKDFITKMEEWRNLRQQLLAEAKTFSHKCTERLNTQSILDNLRVAVMEAEENADVTSEKFINGDIGTEEFLKLFIKQKTLYHKRKSKEEKLAILSDSYSIDKNKDRPI